MPRPAGSPESQIKKLETGFDAGGAASLQNALEVALGPLRGVPPYGQREVHILMAALSTCDPGSIADTIKTCKEQRVRVSIVGAWHQPACSTRFTLQCATCAAS